MPRPAFMHFALLLHLSLAAMTPVAAHAEVDLGPDTPYGETPAERAAKRVVFEWNDQMMNRHDPKGAFERYVSKDFCDHSHMITRGRKDCAGYAETLADMIRQFSASRPVAAKPEGAAPKMDAFASVNGEMVTMYQIGVDLFRVHNGKITDHWDGSPGKPIALTAHVPEFAAWTMGERNGPPPMGVLKP